MYQWPDGDSYDGLWKNGKRNGKGIFNKHDGSEYVGCWINDKWEG